MKRSNIVSIVLVILLFLLNAYFYTVLPNTIVTHWNSNGEANGTMSKFWGLLMLPIMTLIIFLLFLILPKLDPFKNNYKKFQTYYNSFVLIFVIFMFYINLITILVNLSFKLNINSMIIPAVGFLFIYIGIILKNIKRNWFIGIRTPWTLSSDKVWNKTHNLGSKLFIFCGIITIFGIFFSNYLIWFILLPIIISTIWLFIYSYLIYRKEKRK